MPILILHFALTTAFPLLRSLPSHMAGRPKAIHQLSKCKKKRRGQPRLKHGQSHRNVAYLRVRGQTLHAVQNASQITYAANFRRHRNQKQQLVYPSSLTRIGGIYGQNYFPRPQPQKQGQFGICERSRRVGTPTSRTRLAELTCFQDDCSNPNPKGATG